MTQPRARAAQIPPCGHGRSGHETAVGPSPEGVENDIAWTELTPLGGDQAPGYYIFRPVPADQPDHWLSTRTATDEQRHEHPRLPKALEEP
jgi:hypothetical protein